MYLNPVKRPFRIFAATLALFVLAACGQGDGLPPVAGTPQPPITGVLIDSPVSGAAWASSGGASGTTNDLGEFEYVPLEMITFSIGGITLGTTQGAPYVSVVELTNSPDPTATAATNQLVFLQSIDEDSDPTNGIVVSASAAAAAASLTLDFSSANFATEVAVVVEAMVPGNEVVTEADALNHFYTTYADLGGTDTFAFSFPGYPPVGGGSGTFQLVFADEFDSGDTPDPATWNIETGYGPDNFGWGNNEWQLYTNDPQNVRVEDGNLVIQARCDTPPCGVRDGSITSARINTQNKFNFKFGKVVARIKPPVGTGSWPAFWALGSKFAQTGWPRSGEIDFMEMHNAFSNDRTTHSTVHWCDETIQAPDTCSFPDGWMFFTENRTFASSLGDDFHIWEADWNGDRINMSIDGIQYFSRAIEVETMEEFLEEFFLILNVAMGGSLGSNNQPPTGAETFPQTMLVDYVRVFQSTGTVGATTQTIDFEEPAENYDFGISGGFGGGAAAVISNPVAEGINTSDQVVQMLKFEGEVFAGTKYALPATLIVPSGSTYTMKVWSPREVPVLFKLEGTSEAERSVTHTGSGWEELTFDFGSFNGSVDFYTIIFDLGVVGDATGDPDNWTFYFDDITFIPSTSGGPPVGDTGDFPLDFENDPETYNFGPSGGFGGGASAVIDNPVAEGINASDQTARMFKFLGEVFAGSLLELSSPVDVVSGSVFTMKVWSPREVMVLLKLEGPNEAEINLAHGGSGWEELTYDFGSFSGSVEGVTLIFDLGIIGNADTDPDNWTFYYDDIVYIPPADGGDPGEPDVFTGEFEGTPSSYDFGTDGGFGGGFAEVVLNPVADGNNSSAQVVRLLKFLGEVFAGSKLTLPEAVDVMAGSSYTMKVWSQREVMVLLKLEGANEAEVEMPHGGTGWEELTFDFSTFSGTVEGYSFIFDLGTIGNADNDPDNWTFYIDDITLIPPGVIDPGGLAQIDLTITFDDASVDYTVTDFGDPVAVTTTLVADPDDSANMVASTTKPVGAPVWAGTTMSTTDGLATAIPFTVNDTTIGMRVYSPDAGIPVRLKADDVVNGTVSVETETMTTVANQWETLVFDFADQVDTTPALDLSVSYTSLSVFFNFGTDGDTAGTKTYLWDDVEFGVTDMTAPMLATVGITSSNANTALASAGDVITVSLTANEPIMAPAVTIAGSAATVTGAGAVWQATRTLTAGDAEGAITFSIGYSDLAGNAGVAATMPTDMSAVTFDGTAPSVAISGVAATLTTLDPIVVTFQFDEDVSGFDVSDIAVTNGAASAFASTDAATYTASVTPTGEGELTVNVAAAAAADFAGNSSTAATELAALIDSIAPMVVVEGVPADFDTLNAITVTFQFSEPVTGFDLSDVQATNGAASAFVAVDGSTFTADITPDGAGDLTVGVAVGAAQDAAGNPSIVAADITAAIDAVAPTLVIEGVPADFATLDPVSVTFQFSEAVTGFDVSDIQATNGTADGFAAVDSDTYTVDITPDGNGDLVVSVAAGAAQDGVGNLSESAAGVTALVDAVAPTVAIEGAPADFTTLGAISVTFQFSEAVSGFAIGDIQATNGSASDFAAVDAATYTANVTPNGTGDLTIGVAADAAQDGVGNPSTAATNVVVLNALDTDAPLFTAISIASDNANPAFATTGDVVTISMTANEAIAMPTVTINGVAADTVIGAGADWQATRLLASGPETVVVFTLDFEDLDGNAGPQTTATIGGSSVTFDITAPMLALSAPTATFAMLDPIEVTFQFSEDISGFAAGDIAVTNGTASAFASVDTATYTSNVTPDGMGNLTISVAAGAAQDSAGLLSVMATDLVITNAVDVQDPVLTTVSISSDNADSTVATTGDIVTIDITADEEIVEPTVTISGATADAVTGSGATWQATRTLLATDAEGPVTFTIDFEDLVGNAGTQVIASNDASAVAFDRTDATLEITGLAAAFTTLDPIAVTFQFSEDVTGFDVGDIDVTNGAASMFVAVDPATYTADVTPDGVGDLNVAVAADMAVDVAGNTSGGASESSTQDLPPTWQLVWSDEFDGGALSGTNWTARTDADCPAPCDGVQSYSASNVTVAGGLLTIESQENAGPTYLSGLIDTRGKREFKYGRVEIDARMPGTLGTRPSLLMLPATDTYGPWPQSGEVDIANAPDLGDGGSTLLEHTLQYGLPVPENTSTGGTYDAPATPDTTFITYALEWEAGEIRWFVDDVNVLTQSQDNWYAYGEDVDGVFTPGTDDAPFNEDFYLALNLAVDGSADMTSSFPQTLEVDAVRVYECANATDPLAGSGCSTGDPLVLPVTALDAPYTETLDVYTDALATLGFVDESMMTTNGTLVENIVKSDEMTVIVTSTLNGVDPEGGSIWSLDISAPTGTADILVQPGNFPGDVSAFFDLSGGGTTGEILFRMRVNTETGSPALTVGLDSYAGSGEVAVPYTADGQWQNVSVKISDVVTDSVMNATTLDLADIVSLFRLSASTGSINLDIDDIQVKVACRDTNGCEATPGLAALPVTVVYSEGFEGFAIGPGSLVDFSDPTDPIVWRYFNNVFEDGVYQFDYSGLAPKGGPQISALAVGETGVEQGLQALNVYSDYECCAGTNGDPDSGHRSLTGLGTVEVNVFREFGTLLTPDDAGKILRFKLEAKRGNIGGDTQAIAFIKVLDPTDEFSTTAIDFVDTTATPLSWTPYTLEIEVGDWDGQILQIGFQTTSGNFENAGVFYDNVELSEVGP